MELIVDLVIICSVALVQGIVEHLDCLPIHLVLGEQQPKFPGQGVERETREAARVPSPTRLARHMFDFPTPPLTDALDLANSSLKSKILCLSNSAKCCPHESEEMRFNIIGNYVL